MVYKMVRARELEVGDVFQLAVAGGLLRVVEKNEEFIFYNGERSSVVRSVGAKSKQNVMLYENSKHSNGWIR